MEQKRHFFRLKIILLFMVFFFLSQEMYAQKVMEKIVLGHTVSINSQILGEQRTVIIYLPEGYHQSAKKFPVLFLLDGRGHFHHATGIIQFLSQNGRMPQVIVVAISNTNRNRDFTPSSIERMPASGGADNFLDFLQKELIPLINSKYRALPYRILFGHSLTGMFAVYTLATQPDLFNAYIAASPYLQYDNEIVIKKLKDSFAANRVQNKSLYMTIGNEPTYLESKTNITALLNANSSNGLNWKFIKMENEDHGSVPHKTIYDGIEFVFSGWRIPPDIADDMALINNHYKILSNKFGYKIDASEVLINRLGYQALGRGEIEEAIKIFKQNVNTYPESANVHDSLGEAYEKTGNLKLAMKNYEIAVKNGEKSTDRNLAIFKTNLERVQKEQK